jgi:hypothetical protein
MSEITFEAPPSPRRGDARHGSIAAQLRDWPDRWARVAAYSTPHGAWNTAYAIRNGRLRAYEPAGSFEAAARTVDGVHVVYVRYMGQGRP